MTRKSEVFKSKGILNRWIFTRRRATRAMDNLTRGEEVEERVLRVMKTLMSSKEWPKRMLAASSSTGMSILTETFRPKSPSYSR